MAISVKVPYGNVDKAWKALNRKIREEQYMSAAQGRQYYVKPSEQRKLATSASEKKRRKEHFRCVRACFCARSSRDSVVTVAGSSAGTPRDSCLPPLRFPTLGCLCLPGCTPTLMPVRAPGLQGDPGRHHAAQERRLLRPQQPVCSAYTAFALNH